MNAKGFYLLLCSIELWTLALSLLGTTLVLWFTMGVCLFAVYIAGNIVTLSQPSTPSSIVKDISARPPMGTSTPVASVADIAKLLQRQQLSSSPHIVPRPHATPTSTFGIPFAGTFCFRCFLFCFLVFCFLLIII